MGRKREKRILRTGNSEKTAFRRSFSLSKNLHGHVYRREG